MAPTGFLQRFSRPTRPSRRATRRNAVALVLALAFGAIAALLQVQLSNAVYQSGPLYAMDASAQDFLLRNRSPESYGSATGKDPRSLITIVAIDEKSLSELGIWSNWPRTYYAQVVNNIMQAPPRVITFDVGFFDESADVPQLAASFAAARKNVPPTAIVIGTVGQTQGQPGADGDLHFSQVLQPVPELAQNADVASADVVPDDAGVVRTMPLVVNLGDTEVPALGLDTVAKYLRRPKYDDGRPDPDTLLLAGRQIPVNQYGEVRINYFGPPSVVNSPTSTFRVVSFTDVMNGRVDPSIWKDGIVFVGFSNAVGFADDYWTPVSTQGLKMDGVEIHANVAATLLSTQFLRDAPLAEDVALLFLIALLVGVLAANASVVLTAVGTLALVMVYLVANYLTVTISGTQLPVATPVLAALLPFMGITGYRVIVEQRQTRALQGALASVIPPHVAQEIARDPDAVRMGGERRVLTVLFTDLKNFTGFSESVEPELLSRVITEYLNAMTAVIFQHGGTVDKFIGDAVMAFWNAPLDDPDHAQHACEAALEMQKTLAQLGDKWEAEGLQRQYMRIGINTGVASVGNMGTSRRFAYTALGDTINLGARLEPLNNEYGTSICISQATLDAAGGSAKFLVRFLDLVAVKGKKEPAPVYELIGRVGDDVLQQYYGPILVPYGEAMVLYQGQKFGEAERLFRVAMEATGNGPDAPSAVYVARCEELSVTPPEPDWDGVYVMHHK